MKSLVIQIMLDPIETRFNMYIRLVNARNGVDGQLSGMVLACYGGMAANARRTMRKLFDLDVGSVICLIGSDAGFQVYIAVFEDRVAGFIVLAGSEELFDRHFAQVIELYHAEHFAQTAFLVVRSGLGV